MDLERAIIEDQASLLYEALFHSNELTSAVDEANYATIVNFLTWQHNSGVTAVVDILIMLGAPDAVISAAVQKLVN